jgi:hypothetical protein
MKILNIVMTVVLAPLAAQADGGTVCLHEAAGQFLVTVFVSPYPLRAGPADISILVQDRQTGGVVLDSSIKLAIAPVSDKGSPLLTQARRELATNRLLQAARLDLPPGQSTLNVLVSRGHEEAVLSTTLQVVPGTDRIAVIWPLLLFPPLAIGLFAIHQVLKRSKPQRKGTSFRMACPHGR